jgi:HSP20 family molecular chaperone IbpA
MKVNMSSRERRTWMWAEACALLEQADRLHRQFFQLGVSSTRQPLWEPPMDILETEHELIILVALPGVAPSHIRVILDTGTLIVTGQRPIPGASRDATIHRLEIPHGRFERRIELPYGRFELDRKEVADGCLLLSLRKLR